MAKPGPPPPAPPPAWAVRPAATNGERHGGFDPVTGPTVVHWLGGRLIRLLDPRLQLLLSARPYSRSVRPLPSGKWLIGCSSEAQQSKLARLETLPGGGSRIPTTLGNFLGRTGSPLGTRPRWNTISSWSNTLWCCTTSAGVPHGSTSSDRDTAASSSPTPWDPSDP